MVRAVGAGVAAPAHVAVADASWQCIAHAGLWAILASPHLLALLPLLQTLSSHAPLLHALLLLAVAVAAAGLVPVIAPAVVAVQYSVAVAAVVETAGPGHHQDAVVAVVDVAVADAAGPGAAGPGAAVAVEAVAVAQHAVAALLLLQALPSHALLLNAPLPRVAAVVAAGPALVPVPAAAVVQHSVVVAAVAEAAGPVHQQPVTGAVGVVVVVVVAVAAAAGAGAAVAFGGSPCSAVGVAEVVAVAQVAVAVAAAAESAG